MPTFSIPLSGLTAESTALSAIANNLANLNTMSYKDTRIDFRDLFYQTIGSSRSGNPVQLGAGVGVSSMPSNFTQGNVDPTGVPTDVAINQDGFFVVQERGHQLHARGKFFRGPRQHADDGRRTAGDGLSSGERGCQSWDGPDRASAGERNDQSANRHEFCGDSHQSGCGRGGGEHRRKLFNPGNDLRFAGREPRPKVQLHENRTRCRGQQRLDLLDHDPCRRRERLEHAGNRDFVIRWQRKSGESRG